MPTLLPTSHLPYAARRVLRGIALRAVPVLALAAALAGCDSFFDMETTRRIEIPDSEPRLVANSYFEPGVPMAVTLLRSHVRGDYNDMSRPEAYPQATVELYEGTTRIETLHRVSRYQHYDAGPRHDSVFREVQYVGTVPLRAGADYTVRASSPGLPAVEATDTAPDLPVTRIAGVRRTTVAGQRGIALELTIDDGPGDDRYAIWALNTAVSNVWGGSRALLVLSPDPLLRSGLADLVGVDSPELLQAGFGAQAFYLTDEEFSGRSHTFDLRLFSQHGGDASQATLVVSRVSDAYYRYERARFAQSTTEDNPLAEPVTIPSNVRGGLGIVAGRASTRYALRVTN